jgi:hypothetical protein
VQLLEQKAAVLVEYSLAIPQITCDMDRTDRKHSSKPVLSAMI